MNLARVEQVTDRQSLFLRAYEKTGMLNKAGEMSGVPSGTWQYWQANDTQGFNKKLSLAKQVHLEYWESVMDERLENPQGNRGSDPLLMFKLKALAPEKYREDAKAPEIVGVALFEKLVESANKSLPRQNPELMPPEEQTE